MSGLVDPRAREASNLAFRADRLLSAGHVEAAREHFKLAAGLETEVLGTIPTTDPLFSTIAVSAVALYFKAHDDIKREERWYIREALRVILDESPGITAITDFSERASMAMTIATAARNLPP